MTPTASQFPPQLLPAPAPPARTPESTAASPDARRRQEPPAPVPAAGAKPVSTLEQLLLAGQNLVGNAAVARAAAGGRAGPAAKAAQPP
jgi:hypothetical protein